MTAHRRGGRPATGVGKRKRTQQRRRSASTSDENSSDASSITRCVCGETHNLGLMVQCDKCEVWQHCRCMGLEQPDIPDQYFCEQCKPENHKSTRLTNGRIKRQYNALGLAAAPKKRMTLNSREASMSLEDVLAARSALELYESKNESTTAEGDEDELEEEGEVKRKPQINLPETIEEKSEPPSSTVSSVGHDELITEQELSLPPPPPPPVKKVYKKRSKDDTLKKKDSLPLSNEVVQLPPPPPPAKRSYNRTAAVKPKRVNKPRSRTSTPQPECLANTQSQQSDDEVTPNNDNIAAMLFEYFSPRARASSPPAKSRNPHSRMSISEMNRRANQILEYISSIQVNMASAQQGHEEDDNDSLSSASTIPLEEDVDYDKQTSLQIMDMLTRKLIKFQSKFGSRNRALYEEAMMEGEGRITRSREASGNVNTYRNMMAH
ncbi:hypothetical protein EDC94DRAFT_600354 [Helicostylum pulchrum]|nr:hypothetical protein EDC94DRAFT_600354 [Helicostylum pulchrum]